MNTQPFDKLPWRLFLDSSTLQALHSYGEFIYDGGSIDPKDRIWLMPMVQRIFKVSRKLCS